MHPDQLALNVRLSDAATFENFLPGPETATAVAQLADPGSLDLVTCLHGPGDAGKSHLLQATCHQSDSRALYLPLASFTDVPPDALLQDVEALGLVCLDELDAIAGNAAWEEALFHFMNRARMRDTRLVFAARYPAASLGLQLPDLSSRLGGGVQFRLPAPDDQAREAILGFRARRLGLDLPEDVRRYILSRAPRSLADLLSLLTRLDSASLAAQRRLTVPFVKTVLGW